jgi:xanthine dehydrogenase accessory factor
MSPNDIFGEIYKGRADGLLFAIATLVSVAGSTPRQAGARMLVYPDGSISGTIGGGNFEKLVIEDALKLLTGTQKSILKSYNFEETGPDSTGMICGGQAQVFLEKSDIPDKLIIFGGGHICRDLVKIASGLNYKIIVVDERQDILAQYSAPIETRLTDTNYQTNYPEIDAKSYIVIVTHGHRCDKDVLAKVANSNCAYIGMIGSKAKIGRTFKDLEDTGVSPQALARVHSPIGLDIGAEGPFEIAVAIAAELIEVRRKALKNIRK